MQLNIAALFLWCVMALCAVVSVQAGGGGGGHGHHVTIKIPEHVHTVKHTHTIYKTIHHHKGGGGDDWHSHGGKPFFFH